MKEPEHICPFMSARSGNSLHQRCDEANCALWVHQRRGGDSGACAFPAMAIRLSAIEEHLITLVQKSK